MNVNFFTSTTELKEKLKSAIDKNKQTLFERSAEGEAIAMADSVKVKIGTT
jgi:hypothetical protein